MTIISCKKELGSLEENISPNQKVASNATDEILVYIKEIGYKDSEIKYMGDSYLVDGDMIFPKKVKVAIKKEASIPTTSHWSTGNSLGYGLQNIVIQIDASMNGYTNEINSAIAIWNGIPNCRLNFSVNNGSIAVDELFPRPYQVLGDFQRM